MSERNRYTREVSKRVLAAELRMADYMMKEDDDEYAPSYLLLPSGGKANRVVFGGTLTELEDVGGDSENWKARITDSSGGNFLVYAGQYQAEAASTFREMKDDGRVPSFVVVVGKPRIFEPEDDDEKIVTIRPESVTEVSGEERNQLISEAAEHTLERLENDEGEYVEMADERYPDRRDEITNMVIQTVENLQDSS